MTEKKAAVIDMSAAMLGAGIRRRAPKRIAAGIVEIGVVRVGNDRLFAVLAEYRDAMTLRERDDLGVGTLAQKQGHWPRVAFRNKIERALDGAEITGAIGRDCESRCIR